MLSHRYEADFKKGKSGSPKFIESSRKKEHEWSKKMTSKPASNYFKK